MAAFAQPKAVGIRLGAKSFDINYQHKVSKNFVDVNFSVDFPYSECWSGTPGISKNGTGVSLSSTYNFVVATPAWTNKGSWSIYAGPGLALGYVQDWIKFTKDIAETLDASHSTRAMGFMLGIKACIGIEYNFEVPLQMAIEMHPVLGFHKNEPLRYKDSKDGLDLTVDSTSKVGFYNHGLYGFIPSIAIRYKF